MAYKTLDVLADSGGEKTLVSRGSEVTYHDGYTQVVFSGRQRSYDKLSFNYSGTKDKTEPVYALLKQSIVGNEPFYYRFAATEPAKLYRATMDGLSHKHIGGLKWTVTATLREWDGM